MSLSPGIFMIRGIFKLENNSRKIMKGVPRYLLATFILITSFASFHVLLVFAKITKLVITLSHFPLNKTKYSTNDRVNTELLFILNSHQNLNITALQTKSCFGVD